VKKFDDQFLAKTDKYLPNFYITRFSSRPLAWLVKFMLKSVHYAPFLQRSVRLKFV